MRKIRNYVGIACTGHDNAVAIVDGGGNIRFAEASERYLQNKRALQSPADDLVRTRELIDDYCEPGAELVVTRTWSAGARETLRAESARIAKRACKLERVLSRRGLQQLTAEPARLMLGMWQEYGFLLDFVRSSIGHSGNNIAYLYGTQMGGLVSVRDMDHHLAHAATGCYTSPFDEAACAVVDGFGEGSSVQCFSYRDGKLARLGDDDGGDSVGMSLGLFYANLCRWCGFDPWKGEEWKVMGLAAYGELDDEMLLALRGYISADGLRIRYDAAGLTAVCGLLNRLAGKSYEAAEVANLARTGQQVFCEVMTDLLNNLREVSGMRDLVLGGGCALNSSYNGQILERTGFERLHVFAAPADDGNALGAALHSYYADGGTWRPSHHTSPYLGSAVAESSLQAALEHSKAFRATRHANGLASVVARHLAAGKIVGWMQGRAEFGPRALGNRSILADARRADMKARVNAAVKFRESFRPFAPSILHEHGSEYFENYQESPWMERTLRFRPSARSKVPAVVHVDGTGRLQSVRREANPCYHELIAEFHRLTGVPMVLNTSFNVMGRPIVHSVEDALAAFTTTGLDVLAIGNCVFEKPAA